jgi:hypothetical protein
LHHLSLTLSLVRHMTLQLSDQPAWATAMDKKIVSI